MPLFLRRERYVGVPLEATYQAAFDGMPGFCAKCFSGNPPERNNCFGRQHEASATNNTQPVNFRSGLRHLFSSGRKWKASNDLTVFTLAGKMKGC